MIRQEWIELEGRDGAPIGAFLAQPARPFALGVVVLQEVFGVNGHIRAVCTRFAQAGFAALAPAFFEHFGKGLEYGYDAPGLAAGRALVADLGWDTPLRDVRAAADHLLRQREAKRVAAVGFCWGGTLAALCATRLGLPSVSYYGARTAPFLHEHPQAPLLMHFGERDPLFPLPEVERLKAAWPQAEVHLYPAGHGFNCDERADHHPESAALAWTRTLDFLRSLERDEAQARGSVTPF